MGDNFTDIGTAVQGTAPEKKEGFLGRAYTTMKNLTQKNREPTKTTQPTQSHRFTQKITQGVQSIAQRTKGLFNRNKEVVVDDNDVDTSALYNGNGFFVDKKGRLKMTCSDCIKIIENGKIENKIWKNYLYDVVDFEDDEKLTTSYLYLIYNKQNKTSILGKYRDEDRDGIAFYTTFKGFNFTSDSIKENLFKENPESREKKRTIEDGDLKINLYCDIVFDNKTEYIEPTEHYFYKLKTSEYEFNETQINLLNSIKNKNSNPIKSCLIKNNCSTEIRGNNLSCLCKDDMFMCNKKKKKSNTDCYLKLHFIMKYIPTLFFNVTNITTLFDNTKINENLKIINENLIPIKNPNKIENEKADIRNTEIENAEREQVDKYKNTLKEEELTKRNIDYIKRTTAPTVSSTASSSTTRGYKPMRTDITPIQPRTLRGPTTMDQPRTRGTLQPIPTRAGSHRRRRHQTLKKKRTGHKRRHSARAK
jgi:hypothetical protein